MFKRVKRFFVVGLLLVGLLFSNVAYAAEYIQSTATSIMVLMISSTDHISGKTGLTSFTVSISKNGGAFATITPTITERGFGWYSVALTASNTDTLGDFVIHLVTTGADPTDVKGSIVVDPDITIYEDAEDNLTSRWIIYDATPSGAAITNVDDTTRGSRVINLSGSAQLNGYQLKRINGVIWGNTTQFVAEWSMKYSESFAVYFDCDTTAGHRYVYYTNSATSSLGSGEYIHIGLGASVADGTWRAFVRNLQSDISSAQPTTTILRVNGILLRGSGRVDDIKLKKS